MEKRKFDGNNPVKQVKVHVREKDLDTYTRVRIESLIEQDKSGTLLRAFDVVGPVLPEKVPVIPSNEIVRLKRDLEVAQGRISELEAREIDNAYGPPVNSDLVRQALLDKVGEKYDRCSPEGRKNLIRDVSRYC